MISIMTTRIKVGSPKTTLADQPIHLQQGRMSDRDGADQKKNSRTWGQKMEVEVTPQRSARATFQKKTR